MWLELRLKIVWWNKLLIAGIFQSIRYKFFLYSVKWEDDLATIEYRSDKISINEKNVNSCDKNTNGQDRNISHISLIPIHVDNDEKPNSL